MRELYLDEVYSRLGIQHRKHADKVIVVDNRIVIVEETERAKLEDVKKLTETVKFIVDDERLQSELLERSSIEGTMIVVMHSPRRIDDMVFEKLRSDVSNLNRSLKSRGVSMKVYRRVSCSRDLRVLTGYRDLPGSPCTS